MTPDVEVADLSPGSVLIAGFTGDRYRVQGVDRDADRVVLVGPHGSQASSYAAIQRDIASGKIGVDG